MLFDYAQSSVTAYVRALEDDLGVPLFERTAQGMALTKAGTRLLTYAETILRLADEARADVQREGELHSTLTIGASESLCAYRLPDALTAYQVRYPDVRLTVETGPCDALYQGLREGTPDMAVVMDEPRPSGPLGGLVAEPLCREPTLVLAPPGHTVARSPARRPNRPRG